MPRPKDQGTASSTRPAQAISLADTDITSERVGRRSFLSRTVVAASIAAGAALTAACPGGGGGGTDSDAESE